jgi:pimeloyl-ACP methyl ester carboxylesterase
VRIPANGFSLAGTISKPVPPNAEAAALKAKPVPPKAGSPVRYPAVILVGGSGPADRDELVFGIPIFAQVAGALADAGFLVLRYDKRGVGQSGGRADSATLEQYAEDARAVFSYLRNRKDVDRKRIAIAGHSEGGWTAMLAAQKNKDIRALVLIATPGVTGAELVLAQQEHLLQRMNISPAERQAKIDLQKKIQRAVLTGTGWEGIAPELQKQADTLWFHSFLAFDPAKVMPNVKQPILIVQGDLDRQIFAPQADRLAQMARARKAPADKAVTVVHVPGVNHLLVPATTGEYDEYARLTDKNVSTDLLSAITGWLQKTLVVASSD